MRAPQLETTTRISPPAMGPILVIDADHATLQTWHQALQALDHPVVLASDLNTATRLIQTVAPSILVLDLPAQPAAALDFLQTIKQDQTTLVIIATTQEGSVRTTVEALRRGASTVVAKPISTTMIPGLLAEAASLSPTSRVQTHEDDTIIAEDPAMQRMLALAQTVAASHATVLITGEPGTGKARLARWIHQHSPRANRPFVTVNCAAIPATQLERELFGSPDHLPKGSRRTPGRCELAHTGTVVLQDIASVPLDLQATLLHLLQTRQGQQLSRYSPHPLDCRLIATTTKPLAQAVREGRFREDLFYRLHVFPLAIPALRDRPSDIPSLARHLLARSAERQRLHAPTLSDPAVIALTRHPWPGNVRELETVIERAMVLAGDQTIHPAHLQLEAPQAIPAAPPALTWNVEQAEHALIMAALQHTKGNRTQAAQLLGISLRTLRNRLRTYRTEPDSLSEAIAS